MNNKLGSYIQSLMTHSINTENDEFIRNLALDELKRLNQDITDFVRKNTKDDSEQREETEKKLLQENKNGDN
jgi:hypothetical protein